MPQKKEVVTLSSARWVALEAAREVRSGLVISPYRDYEWKTVTHYNDDGSPYNDAWTVEYTIPETELATEPVRLMRMDAYEKDPGPGMKKYRIQFQLLCHNLFVDVRVKQFRNNGRVEWKPLEANWQEAKSKQKGTFVFEGGKIVVS